MPLNVASLEAACITTGVWDFFPTPEPVRARMFTLASLRAGQSILEPSAGSGDLLDGIRALSLPYVGLWACENHPDLRRILTAKGYELLPQWDFLSVRGYGFDRIVMNPPFSKGIDRVHVRHAYSLLRPGGRLVACVHANAIASRHPESVAYQRWLASIDAHGELCAPDAFLHSKRPTPVQTCLLCLTK